MKYPDQYLLVTENQSGEQWIYPIRANAKLCLETLVKRWAKQHFGLDTPINTPIRVEVANHSFGGLSHHAAIITDGRPPDSVVVWTSKDVHIEIMEY